MPLTLTKNGLQLHVKGKKQMITQDVSFPHYLSKRFGEIPHNS